jgi:hypothetical protein
LNKKIAAIAVGVAVLVSTTAGACDTDPTHSPTGDVARTTGYSVVADWTRIPSNNDQATDIWVRVIKIEGICFTQTSSVHDWEYSLVPMHTTC